MKNREVQNEINSPESRHLTENSVDKVSRRERGAALDDKRTIGENTEKTAEKYTEKTIKLIFMRLKKNQENII